MDPPKSKAVPIQPAGPLPKSVLNSFSTSSLAQPPPPSPLPHQLPVFVPTPKPKAKPLSAKNRLEYHNYVKAKVAERRGLQEKHWEDEDPGRTREEPVHLEDEDPERTREEPVLWEDQDPELEWQKFLKASAAKERGLQEEDEDPDGTSAGSKQDPSQKKQLPMS